MNLIIQHCSTAKLLLHLPRVLLRVEQKTEKILNTQQKGKLLLAATCVNAKSCICSEKDYMYLNVIQTTRSQPICSKDCQILSHASYKARCFAQFLMGASETVESYYLCALNDCFRRQNSNEHRKSSHIRR